MIVANGFVYLLFSTSVFKSKVIAANRKLRGTDYCEELECTLHSPACQTSSDSDCHRISDTAVEKDSDDDAQFCRAVHLHEAHDRFLQDQIQSAREHMKRKNDLPAMVSSQRPVLESPDEPQEYVGMEERLVGKGPRTVSSAEKNRRRKLKKKKARLKD